MTHVQPSTAIGVMFEGNRYRCREDGRPPYAVRPVGDDAAMIRDARGIECVGNAVGNVILERGTAERLCEVLNRS